MIEETTRRGQHDGTGTIQPYASASTSHVAGLAKSGGLTRSAQFGGNTETGRTIIYSRHPPAVCWRRFRLGQDAVGVLRTRVKRKMTFLLSYLREKIDGNIDVYTGKRIVGWIKKRRHTQSVMIDIYIDDTCVASSVRADRMRPDVKAAGHGNGAYGFDVEIPAAGLDQANATITIKLSGERRPALSRTIAQILSRAPSGSRREGSSDASASKSKASKGDTPKPAPLPTAQKTAKYRVRIERVRADEIVGWAIDLTSPGAVFTLDISIDGCFYKSVWTSQSRDDLRRKKLSDGLGGFTVRLLPGLFDDGEHTVAARAPDGTVEERKITTIVRRVPRFSDFITFTKQRITVVVPIYNAYDDLVICLENLQRYTPGHVKVLLINDGSTDQRIAHLLAGVHGQNNIEVVHNTKNIGFTGTVNRGIAESAPDDVIILNSDARVTPGWLEGLYYAARSAPRIATVTPMSDRAGAFSAPTIGNENNLPPGISEASYARAFRRRSLGLYPIVPTGNGFCMYISRACLNEIGSFDAEAFPRGYGEENDFCMRARRAGWRNIIDDRTYVFHDRSKSFLGEKKELLASGRAVIENRHPDYKLAIEIFSTSEQIAAARFRAFQALKDCETVRTLSPRILYVTSTQTGGTPQTNSDLMSALDDAIDSWNLRCDSNLLELTHLVRGKVEVVRRHNLDESVDPLTHMSSEYDAVVTEWLLSFDFDLIHIRHLAWHSLSLPSLAKSLGRKVIFSLHDFYTLSPTIKLIDDTGTFLGSSFFQEGSIYRESLWPGRSQPRPDGEWLKLWRERFEDVLTQCDRLITTSRSARDLILSHFSALSADRFPVIPHGRDFAEFSQVPLPPKHGQPLRILVPGNINSAKGLEIIDRLVEHDSQRLLEFHILGNINSKQLSSTIGIVKHGPYQRNDFIKKVHAIRPHFGAVFSIWDETYCHTLTELWAAGLPTFVFNFPNVATRVRESGAGWVLDHHDIRTLYRTIIDVAFNAEEQERAFKAVAQWQVGLGVGNTTRVMAARYFDVYRQVLRGYRDPMKGGASSPSVGVVCSNHRNLKSGEVSTHVRIWERTRNEVDRDVTYIRMTPETLLANLRDGGVQGAIIRAGAVPGTMEPELVRAFTASKVPYVFDLSDNLTNVLGNEDTAETDAARLDPFHGLLAGASLVTAPTPKLLESVRSINPKSMLLPDRLSDRLWRPSSASRRPDGHVRGLYIGSRGPRSNLGFMVAALDAVAAAHPRFRLVVVGRAVENLPLDGTKNWLEHIVTPREFQQYDSFVPWLRTLAASCDFAVAPLIDDPLDASGTALECLEYAALSLPVLCSDVDVYREGIASAPGVFLVKNNAARWESALTERIQLGNDNQPLGEANRRWVEGTHMLEPTLSDFDRIFIELANDAGK